MILNAIDRTRPHKLYYQLLELLKMQIERGEWKVGTQIPTEDKLCSLYNLSKATVRLAISELCSLGYLKKMQGKGTYVRRRKPAKNIMMLVNLAREEIHDKHSFVSRLLENKTIRPEQDARDFLGLPEEDFCLLITRLFISGKSPVLLQKFHIPYSLSNGFSGSDELSEAPIYEFFEDNYGIKIQRIKEITDVYAASSKDAGHMEINPEHPVLRVRHICYAPGDMPVIFSEELYRTDAGPKVLELERLKI